MIEQTKTRHQETLEFAMNKQFQTLSFSPPINLIEEGKWLPGVTSFECTNSVFNINHENNSLSIATRGQGNSGSNEKTIDELNKLLELRSEKDIELPTKQIRRRGLFSTKTYSSSSLGTFEEEILEELRNAN